MANLADVVGTAAGIALAKFNLPVLPTFCLLSLGYLYSSRCALVALRLAHVAVLCRFHPLPGLAGLPLLPGRNWMLQVAARWMLGGDVASLAPTSGTPGLGARVHRMSRQRTYSPPCPLCLCRREVDSVVLPYLNRARLSYTARSFLSTGASSALACSLACLPAGGVETCSLLGGCPRTRHRSLHCVYCCGCCASCDWLRATAGILQG